MATVTGVPVTILGGTMTRKEDSACGAATFVLPIPATCESLSEVTVTVCLPTVANETGNVARPFLKSTSTMGSEAAASLLVTVAVPLKVGAGRPAASTASAVTVVGMPARTCGGIITSSLVATTGGATVVEAVAVRSATRASVTVSVCGPAVRKVTGTSARPLRS